MSSPFERYGQMARERVAAVLATELAIDPMRAERYAAVLQRGLVAPRPVGCQPGLPERDVRPSALLVLWLVYEEPPSRGDRYFMVFDPDRREYGLGVWEGDRAWFLKGWGGFFAMLEQLADAGG